MSGKIGGLGVHRGDQDVITMEIHCCLPTIDKCVFFIKFLTMYQRMKSSCGVSSVPPWEHSAVSRMLNTTYHRPNYD
jgi:hypothetical protein